MNSNASINVCGGCPGAQLAANDPPEFRRPKSTGTSLVALLLPGLLFGVGLFLLRDNPQFQWARHVTEFPWQFWVIAGCGVVATLAGMGDWAYHRWAARCVVGRKERNCELLALVGGGVPMFVLMSAASLSGQPAQFLVPVIVVLLFTVTLICYDEFIFHRRRCRRMETVLHRLLVFGNGAAWLAWAHWCFVAERIHG